MSTVYKCRGCNMTTLLPLGSAKSDSKNMKFTLMSGPPVDKKCEHCGFPHLVSGLNLKSINNTITKENINAKYSN